MSFQLYRTALFARMPLEVNVITVYVCENIVKSLICICHIQMNIQSNMPIKMLNKVKQIMIRSNIQDSTTIYRFSPCRVAALGNVQSYSTVVWYSLKLTSKDS